MGELGTVERAKERPSLGTISTSIASQAGASGCSGSIETSSPEAAGGADTIAVGGRGTAMVVALLMLGAGALNCGRRVVVWLVRATGGFTSRSRGAGVFRASLGRHREVFSESIRRRAGETWGYLEDWKGMSGYFALQFFLSVNPAGQKSGGHKWQNDHYRIKICQL